MKGTDNCTSASLSTVVKGEDFPLQNIAFADDEEEEAACGAAEDPTDCGTLKFLHHPKRDMLS